VDQRPNAVPIYQSVTFSTDDAEELADVLNGRRPGYAYSRIDNPTSAALADAVAQLEGAEAGFAFATGMAAIHAAVISIVGAGDQIVATHAMYGSTRSLLTRVLGGLGIRTEFVDPTDLDGVERALAERPTRLLYLETVANPTIVVSDIAALAELAHAHGATVIVDNTFASPYLCRPLELGADLVVESGTKYLSGHSDVLAGIVCGSVAHIAKVRAIQTDTGASLAPLAAFLVLRGLPTLALRMERHSASASVLAAWLERQPPVERVYYPALASHPQHEVARRHLASGGGMFAVELAGGREAGRAFIDALTIPERTASLGSIHTIVAHPASTTHRQLKDAELAAAGVARGLLRFSIGLEDVEDLRADFDGALAAARSVSSTSPVAIEAAATS
jgi:cystathionine beta-lyase/cystathionine gamma-synthase